MDYPEGQMKFIKNNLKLIIVVLVALGLFFAGYSLSGNSSGPQSIQQASQDNKDYYISFDDYYYEVPKQKTADDKIVLGAQFVYNLNVAIKTNTLDDLFNQGAIGVQALVPLNSENQPFERYINDVAKPQAESSFPGGTEVTFGIRKEDGVRTAELISKKDGQVIRRQYIINLPQSVAIVTKDDSEAFKAIGRSIGQASVKFSDYESMKIQVLAASYLIKNRMFEDVYKQAHEDLRNTTSADELNGLADRSKEIFAFENKMSGIKLSKNEMTAAVYFIDPAKPESSKIVTLTFRQSGGEWKLFTLQLPNGSATGATPADQQVR